MDEMLPLLVVVCDCEVEEAGMDAEEETKEGEGEEGEEGEGEEGEEGAGEGNGEASGEAEVDTAVLETWLDVEPLLLLLLLLLLTPLLPPPDLLVPTKASLATMGVVQLDEAM